MGIRSYWRRWQAARRLAEAWERGDDAGAQRIVAEHLAVRRPVVPVTRSVHQATRHWESGDERERPAEDM